MSHEDDDLVSPGDEPTTGGFSLPDNDEDLVDPGDEPVTGTGGFQIDPRDPLQDEPTTGGFDLPDDDDDDDRDRDRGGGGGGSSSGDGRTSGPDVDDGGTTDQTQIPVPEEQNAREGNPRIEVEGGVSGDVDRRAREFLERNYLDDEYGTGDVVFRTDPETGRTIITLRKESTRREAVEDVLASAGGGFTEEDVITEETADGRIRARLSERAIHRELTERAAARRSPRAGTGGTEGAFQHGGGWTGANASIAALLNTQAGYAGTEGAFAFEGIDRLADAPAGGVDSPERRAELEIEAALENRVGRELERGRDYTITREGNRLRGELTESTRRELAERGLEEQIETRYEVDVEPGEDFEAVRRDGEYYAQFTSEGRRMLTVEQSDMVRLTEGTPLEEAFRWGAGVGFDIREAARRRRERYLLGDEFDAAIATLGAALAEGEGERSDLGAFAESPGTGPSGDTSVDEAVVEFLASRTEQLAESELAQQPARDLETISRLVVGGAERVGGELYESELVQQPARDLGVIGAAAAGGAARVGGELYRSELVQQPARDLGVIGRRVGGYAASETERVGGELGRSELVRGPLRDANAIERILNRELDDPANRAIDLGAFDESATGRRPPPPEQTELEQLGTGLVTAGAVGVAAPEPVTSVGGAGAVAAGGAILGGLALAAIARDRPDLFPPELPAEEPGFGIPELGVPETRPGTRPEIGVPASRQPVFGGEIAVPETRTPFFVTEIETPDRAPGDVDVPIDVVLTEQLARQRQRRRQTEVEDALEQMEQRYRQAQDRGLFEEVRRRPSMTYTQERSLERAREELLEGDTIVGPGDFGFRERSIPIEAAEDRLDEEIAEDLATELGEAGVSASDILAATTQRELQLLDELALTDAAQALEVRPDELLRTPEQLAAEQVPINQVTTPVEAYPIEFLVEEPIEFPTPTSPYPFAVPAENVRTRLELDFGGGGETPPGPEERGQLITNPVRSAAEIFGGGPAIEFVDEGEATPAAADSIELLDDGGELESYAESTFGIGASAEPSPSGDLGIEVLDESLDDAAAGAIPAGEARSPVGGRPMLEQLDDAIAGGLDALDAPVVAERGAGRARGRPMMDFAALEGYLDRPSGRSPRGGGLDSMLALEAELYGGASARGASGLDAALEGYMGGGGRGGGGGVDAALEGYMGGDGRGSGGGVDAALAGYDAAFDHDYDFDFEWGY